LTGKRLQLLKDLVPRLARLGVLANPALAYLPFVRDTERAAQVLGLMVRLVEVSAPADLPNAFSTMDRERVDAVFVLPDLMLARQAKRGRAQAHDHARSSSRVC
jgi:putative ABC transport system substrate-binding protein